MALLLVILRPIRLTCTVAFGLGLTRGPRALATCHTTTFTAHDYRQTLILAETTTLLTFLFINLQPLWPKLLGSLQLRWTPRASVSRCLSAFHIYGPSPQQPSAKANPTSLVASLLGSLRLLRPLLLDSLRLRFTPRPSCLRCLSAFGLQDLTAT